MRRKLTREEVLRRFKEAHGDKYDYSEFVYIKAKVKSKIKCNKCLLVFEQNSDSHASGNGCPTCALHTRARARSKSPEKFIEDAIKVHGNRYLYGKVDYINSNTNVTITCKIHGDFNQFPANHLTGSGCIKCGFISSSRLRITTEVAVKRCVNIHGTDLFDYSQVEYKGADVKIKIGCKTCGDWFYKTLSHHTVTKQGCPGCAGRKRYTQKEAIEKFKRAHGERYDYSQVDYINAKNPCDYNLQHTR